MSSMKSTRININTGGIMSIKVMAMYTNEEIEVLLEQLKKYLFKYPLEVEMVRTLESFIIGDLNLSEEHLRGHMTGSSWIVNKDRNKGLFTLHSKLNKWLQLGGHVDIGESVIEGATREAFEESGLKSVKLLSLDIYDIDIHLIPENHKGKAHYHFDIRYLYEADDREELGISLESKDLKWIPLEELEEYNNEESILRMKRKLEVI